MAVALSWAVSDAEGRVTPSIAARPQLRSTNSPPTGAFTLAKAGLLDGKNATTHHGAYDELANAFPRVHVQRGRRYVDADRIISTSGGLSAGIDLALHLVERLLEHDIALETARTMEYEGQGWKDGRASISYAGHR